MRIQEKIKQKYALVDPIKPYLKAINNLSHLHNLKLPPKKAIQNGKMTIL